jgi:hypothetical protein
MDELEQMPFDESYSTVTHWAPLAAALSQHRNKKGR